MSVGTIEEISSMHVWWKDGIIRYSPEVALANLSKGRYVVYDMFLTPPSNAADIGVAGGGPFQYADIQVYVRFM